MHPGNDAAMIVLACRALDSMLKKKYMIIGGTIVLVIALLIFSVSMLWMNENWFLFAFVLPFLVWFGVEKYVNNLNAKMNELLKVIRCNDHGANAVAKRGPTIQFSPHS